jgi:hypothetical protein
MRQLTRHLHCKRTKYRLAKTYRGRYWLFLHLMACSFCRSLHWSDAHPRTQSLCSPPTTNKRPFSNQIVLLDGSLDTVLIGLPFHDVPIKPTFNPIAGYPRRLCIFQNVQLCQEFCPSRPSFWFPNLPAFPVRDLSVTGIRALYHTLLTLRPHRKPPYCPIMAHSMDILSTTDASMIRAYLNAFISGSTGKLPIPFSVNAKPICIDSGASLTISNNKDDFLCLRPITDQHLSGIATGLPISGIGTLKWTFLTDSGAAVALHIMQALYVPACPMNLLSPQHLAQQTKGFQDGFKISSSTGTLTFSGHTRTVLLDRQSNLPIFYTIGESDGCFHTKFSNIAVSNSCYAHAASIDHLSSNSCFEPTFALDT